MGRLFVSVDYKTFMDLLPPDTKCLSDVDKSKAGDFQGFSRKECRRETAMYPILCETLEKTLKLSKNDLTFKDCAEWQEGQVHDGKPHIVAYRKDILAAQKAYEYKGNTTVKDPRKPYRAGMAYAWVELLIEVKYSHLDGGFSFDKDLLRDSIKGKKARAQLIRYATQIMHHQHRTHLYMVCMTRSHARLLRWDRAGVLVSESIDLLAHPEQLLDFIHRFAQMTPEQRGRDPTAIPVEEDSDEFRRFRDFEPATDWARKCHKEIFADTTSFPIYKILCQPVASSGAPSKSSAEHRAFFVGKAMTRVASLTGRATRGFAAYDQSRNRLVFYKDFWRPNSQKIRRELDTYALLNRRGVPNIATAIAGGDVLYNNASQHTLTQTYIQSATGPRPLERIHGRLVLAELACPLEDYFGSYELISVVNDAIQAHKEAWEAGVLHRDISVANIMISDTEEPGKRKGLLMDWDLCKYKEDMKLEATQPGGRSGTWAYMSWLSLQYPRKPVAVSDDLESFLYVLEHCALRFHSHSLSPRSSPTSTELAAIHTLNGGNGTLSTDLQGFFYEECENADGSVTGGLIKQRHIESARPLAKLRLSNSPLAVVLKKLYDLARDHYDTIDFQELEKYGPPKLDIGPVPSSVPSSWKNRGLRFVDPPKPQRLPLATHVAVLDVFQDVLSDYEDSISFKDKTFDQFYGLSCFEDVQPTDTISKRPSVDSLHVEERKQKKRKVDSRSLHSIGEHGDDHA
ncbi:hypothetical protein BDW22DRAFT_1351985 [Trametopsis cervina]|nr:hypothetical protein BDW22DRAFT_1351985 [Trametopsis cervina]